MICINKKGQLAPLAYILIIIILTPFVLVWFSDVIDGSLDEAENSIPEESIVGNFIIIAFKPILWIGWFILTLIVLGGVLFRGAS